MTIPGRDQTGDPWQRCWTWDQQVPPRWLLVGHSGMPQFPSEDAVGLCVDIIGMLEDAPPRPRERFCLVGCLPTGRLASSVAAVCGGRGVGDAATTWLGNVWISAPPDDPATRRGWVGVQLLDVNLLEQRPSASAPGRYDIDLEGLVDVRGRTGGWRPGDITEFVLNGTDGTPVGVCANIMGALRDPDPPLVGQVALVGCRPGALTPAVGHADSSTMLGKRDDLSHGPQELLRRVPSAGRRVVPVHTECHDQGHSR